MELVRERPEQFPALHEMTARRTRTPRQTRDFGLQCVLDGVEKTIRSAGA